MAKFSKIKGTVRIEINAQGKIVSLGFIDMLSCVCDPILYDGFIPSVVKQGITTALFGKGWSMEPINSNVKQFFKELVARIQH